jgi:hypothetical protein
MSLKGVSVPEASLLGLAHFVEVFLEFRHLVGNEAEGVMQGLPLNIRVVAFSLVAKLVEFGEQRLGPKGGIIRHSDLPVLKTPFPERFNRANCMQA